MRTLYPLLACATLGLATGRADAQSLTPPWDGAAVASSRAPSLPAHEVISPERYGSTPDPATTHYFQMPSARPLRLGDTMITAAGALGWLGLRHGFTRRFDAGIGLPFYIAGISLDARYALVLDAGVAVSAWAYASVPVLPGDGANPTGLLGFTWRGAGPSWGAGPLVSIWGERVGLHFGAAAVQRTLLGGVWALGHVTLDAKITDVARFIVQTLVLAEVADEGASGRPRDLIGTVHPRVFPYAIAGVRLHSRRFAVDFGVLVAFASDSPLATTGAGVWPWTSVAQLF